MTHDELIASIQGILDYGCTVDTKRQLNALRAVVELHKPTEGWEAYMYCESCQEIGLGDYPCPTIQAIEAALNA